jgi:hypothetical protein
VPPSEFERNFARLEAELKRLEAEYNMYFSGRLPKPPWETRSRVDALIKQYDRMHIQNYADKFRFTALQTRYSTFVDLWDRGLRAKEEGRPGPFAHKRAQKEPEKKKPVDGVVHTSSFRDPVKEADKLAELYKSVVEARRAVGEEPVPYEKFAGLIKNQVEKLGKGGEVAFQVAVKDGKVSFTARALKARE